MQKVTIKKILNKKGRIPITCLTAYSKEVAKILDKYCDIILVGDSVGMVLYGMKNTKEVKLDTMIEHGKAVKRFSKKIDPSSPDRYLSIILSGCGIIPNTFLLLLNTPAIFLIAPLGLNSSLSVPSRPQ